MLIAAVTDERNSETARTWLSQAVETGLVASGWCVTETASGLAIKHRTGAISLDHRERAMTVIRQIVATSAAPVAVTHADCWQAAELIARSRVALRAGDALHLAIATRVGAEVVTLDRRMAAAGVALGLDVRLLA